MKRQAFTLVELLVVLAIVALLFALLLPVFRKALDSAHTAACSANLKSLAAAGMAWSADHDGWVPPASWYAAEKGGSPDSMRFSEYGISEKNLICPGADPSLKAQGMKVQYGMNQNLVMVGPSSGTSAGDAIDWSSYPWGPGDVYFWERGNCKIISVPNPANIVFFMDTGPFIWADAEDIGGTQSYLASYNNNIGTPLTRRHGGKAQIAWLDGHVSIEPDDFKYSIRHTGFTWMPGGDPDAAGKYFTH